MAATKKIEQFSNEIEPELQNLWNTLVKFKHYDKSVNIPKPEANEAMNFQYCLTKTLYKISNQHFSISNLNKALLKRQRHMNHVTWLAEKEEFKNLLEYLNFLMVVARSFGDAFVYIFYGQDREYLDKHLEAPVRKLSMPRGIGGMGEMEFVKRVKVLEGEFVIYHGITNILRIGDASLFNIQELKATAVVELKSGQKTNRDLFLRLTVIGHESRNEKFQQRTSKVTSQTSSEFKLPEKAQARFQKQVKEMYESFKFLDKEPSSYRHEPKLFYSKSKHEAIEHLASLSDDNVMQFQQIGDNMLLGSLRYLKPTIFERLMSKYPESAINKENITSMLTNILINSAKSELTFGQVHFNEYMRIEPMLGTQPFFWEPLSLEALKKIYFGEIIFFTIYNIGAFFEAMENRGFEYVFDEQHKMYVFRRKEGDKCGFVSGIDYFVRLMTDYLQDESTILGAIDASYTDMKDSGRTGYTKLEIFLK